MTKKEFLGDLDEIITDQLYLTERVDEIDREIQCNHWSIGVQARLAQELSTKDLTIFLEKVIRNRQDQLNESTKKLDLFFYLWFDEQAGNLNFNFINAEHEKLPFGAKLELVNSMNQIIDQLLKSDCLDSIPFHELKDVSDAHEEEEIILQVYVQKVLKS